MFILLAAAAGLAAGSVLGVVVHRLPLMLEEQWRRQPAKDGGPRPASGPTLATPRSHCPHCRQPIPWYGLVPLVGFILLRGRCARCRTSIPLRYPLIELLCAVGTALCAWRFGVGWPAAGAVALTWALIALAFIDIERHLLPDTITLPMLWAGIGFNLAGGYLATLEDAVLGAMVGYGVLWLVQRTYRRLRGREGLGTGDLKLTAMLGGWLGWEVLPGVVFLASLGGVGAGLVKRGPFAFGPWLALAGWLALVGGDAWGDTARSLPSWPGSPAAETLRPLP